MTSLVEDGFHFDLEFMLTEMRRKKKSVNPEEGGNRHKQLITATYSVQLVKSPHDSSVVDIVTSRSGVAIADSCFSCILFQTSICCNIYVEPGITI